jgi:hypothetical protein
VVTGMEGGGKHFLPSSLEKLKLKKGGNASIPNINTKNNNYLL